MANSGPGAKSAPRPVSIISVARCELLTVRFLGSYSGILEHWGKKPPSHACEGIKCNREWHGLRTVWKGFAPVEQWEEQTRLWVPSVLEITEALETQLRGQDLRGLVWSMFVVQAGNRHKKCEALQLPPVDSNPLRPAFDVRPVVAHCYRQLDIVWDVPNPVPARIVMQPHEGTGPELPVEVRKEFTNERTPEEVAEVKAKLAEMRAMFRQGNRRPLNSNGATGKGANHGQAN